MTPKENAAGEEKILFNYLNLTVDKTAINKCQGNTGLGNISACIYWNNMLQGQWSSIIPCPAFNVWTKCIRCTKTLLMSTSKLLWKYILVQGHLCMCVVKKSQDGGYDMIKGPILFCDITHAKGWGFHCMIMLKSTQFNYNDN